MDRKRCVLFYSNFSPKSQEILEMFNKIDDFVSVVGLTLVNVDNVAIRKTLIDNGIEQVPTLLIDYYSSERQKLSFSEIPNWVEEMLSLMTSDPNIESLDDANTFVNEVTFDQFESQFRERRPGPGFEERHEPIITTKKNLHEIASEMQNIRGIMEEENPRIGDRFTH